MSQWTHVAGMVRIDAIREDPFVPETPLDIGTGWDGIGPWNDPSIPTGSEGSLKVEVAENPNMSHINAYAISISGDLRDFDDVRGLLRYIRRITKGHIVRQGIVTIDVEFKRELVVEYSRLQERWLIVKDFMKGAVG